MSVNQLTCKGELVNIKRGEIMRRKIAYILIPAILGCNILIVANASLKKETRENINTAFFDNNTATISDAKKSTASNTQKEDKNIADILAEEGNVCKVSFPTNIHACLDPGNLLGRGQVFSDSYIVENYGNSDIVIKIKNIQVTCSESEITEELFSGNDVSSQSDTKKFNIKMIWKNEIEKTEKVLYIENGTPDKYVLFLKAAKYNKDNEYVSLNDSSRGLFYFTGTLNNDSEIEWENSRISVKFDYEIEKEEDDE